MRLGTQYSKKWHAFNELNWIYPDKPFPMLQKCEDLYVTSLLIEGYEIVKYNKKWVITMPKSK